MIKKLTPFILYFGSVIRPSELLFLCLAVQPTLETSDLIHPSL